MPDWYDKRSVIRRADEIGRDVIVVKYNNRTNFNIINRRLVDIWGRNDVQIVHEPTR